MTTALEASGFSVAYGKMLALTDASIKLDLILPMRAPITLETSPRSIGWVFAPLSAADALRDLDDLEHTFSLVLRDRKSRVGTQPFYASRAATHERAAGLTARVPLDIFGRSWSIELRSHPGCGATGTTRRTRARPAAPRARSP